MQLFSYRAIQTFVLGAQKNRLIGSFEYLQHMFWLRNMKNSFQVHTIIWKSVSPSFTLVTLLPYHDSAMAYIHLFMK